LILHPKDKDHDRFYLCVGMNGEYDIRGWIFGIEGKRSEYWDDPTRKGRPAFFVPQEKLEKV
jgi:hypothetical protein